MKNPIEFELNGQTYYLLLNAAALFDLYDKFGTGDLLKRITGTSRKNYSDLVWMLVKLSQQGELLRRYQGETPGQPLGMEEAIRTMSPTDAARARMAILSAYKAGFDREVPSEDADSDDDDYDEGLRELEKKTGLIASVVRGICAVLRRCLAYLSKRVC